MDTNTVFYLLWNLHIILESLPISSSGHLQLINNLIPRITKKPPLIISTTLDYIMHIPTLLVIAIFLTIKAYLAVQFIPNFSSLITSNFIYLCGSMLIANSMTFACFLFFKLTKKPQWPLWVGFLLTGCSLLSLLVAPTGTKIFPTYIDAALIGFAQCFSLLPAISRLALTFVTGIWVGLTPTSSFLFSLSIEFFLILGAELLAFYSYVRKKQYIPRLRLWSFSSLIIACVIAYVLLDLMLFVANTDTLRYFGFYLIALAICLIVTSVVKKFGMHRY